jgi:hypothetical protein
MIQLICFSVETDGRQLSHGVPSISTFSYDFDEKLAKTSDNQTQVSSRKPANSIDKKNASQSAKHTAAGIPTWSPTVVLICRSTAYVWQSGRDAQFSADCGRMCKKCFIVAIACLRHALFARRSTLIVEVIDTSSDF